MPWLPDSHFSWGQCSVSSSSSIAKDSKRTKNCLGDSSATFLKQDAVQGADRIVDSVLRLGRTQKTIVQGEDSQAPGTTELNWDVFLRCSQAHITLDTHHGHFFHPPGCQRVDSGQACPCHVDNNSQKGSSCTKDHKPLQQSARTS